MLQKSTVNIAKQSRSFTEYGTGTIQSPVFRRCNISDETLSSHADLHPEHLATTFYAGRNLEGLWSLPGAALHFTHALDLNPGFQPAKAHLREMEGTPSPTVTQYTLFIILFLVLGVIFGVITSIEASFDDPGEVKTQRHFNRAMAMRSIKLGINPKLIRMRKMNY